MSNSSSEEAAVVQFITIVIVVMVIVFYYLVRAFCLIIRTLAHYPEVKSLWWLLGGWLAFGGLSGATYQWPTVAGIFGALSGLCWIVLLLECMYVEERHNRLFHREHVNTIHQVLHEPWWQWTPAA